MCCCSCCVALMPCEHRAHTFKTRPNKQQHELNTYTSHIFFSFIHSFNAFLVIVPRKASSQGTDNCDRIE